MKICQVGEKCCFFFGWGAGVAGQFVDGEGGCVWFDARCVKLELSFPTCGKTAKLTKVETWWASCSIAWTRSGDAWECVVAVWRCVGVCV